MGEAKGLKQECCLLAWVVSPQGSGAFSIHMSLIFLSSVDAEGDGKKSCTFSIWEVSHFLVAGKVSINLSPLMNTHR